MLREVSPNLSTTSCYSNNSSHTIKNKMSSPALRPQILKTPDLTQKDTQALRESIREYFINTFEIYESLFECLACEEAFYQKPITLRHPLIFYYGHTATFFINKLLLTHLITERLNPRYEALFAVGVDEMSWDDLDDKHYDWPSPQQVKAYRDQVKKVVLDVIDTAPLSSPVNWEHPWWAIMMGIEHERIHLETSSVLIRQQHLDLVKAYQAWQPSQITSAAPQNELIDVAAGKVRHNQQKDNAYYGWDNEFGHHEAEITAFTASKYIVSNHEFLGFVEAGGYLDSAYWGEEGQGWLNFSEAEHPTFWLKKPDGWYLRLMTEEVPMRWDWPVEVNYHEAKAFCQWKSQQLNQNIRLPTEDEWCRLYDVASLQEVGKQPADANIHLDYAASSCPVNTFQHGDFFDVRGNVWQWTETPIYPYNGFEVHPIYDDFTTPTFDERHNLMKGGSWISCGNESLYASRYAFRRHFFQHAGFRYVASEQAVSIPDSHYETDQFLSQYAEFHFGSEYFGVPNFSKALAELAIETMIDRPKVKALDIGCAVGRATFELARAFEHVTGIDFSARFIQHGVQLTKGETLRYTLATEGELVQYKACSLHQLGLEQIKDKVDFYQGDACNLKSNFAGYDLIFAANLIDRLYRPSQFLSQIHQRLNLGGVLMIASPYTWLEEHTPREEWIGGFKKDGESFTTLDGLHAILDQHFRLITASKEVPFVIRETQHKFQHSLSEVTFWERID